MKCTIKCSCGCSITLTERQVSELKSFACPICSTVFPEDHVKKIKQCDQLIKECKTVKRTDSAHNGILDLTPLFTVSLEL